MKESIKKKIKEKGAELKALRKKEKRSLYWVAKKAETYIDNIKVVEEGETNYTIGSFMSYIEGCNIEIKFERKSL